MAPSVAKPRSSRRAATHLPAEFPVCWRIRLLLKGKHGKVRHFVNLNSSAGALDDVLSTMRRLAGEHGASFHDALLLVVAFGIFGLVWVLFVLIETKEADGPWETLDQTVAQFARSGKAYHFRPIEQKGEGRWVAMWWEGRAMSKVCQFCCSL